MGGGQFNVLPRTPICTAAKGTAVRPGPNKKTVARLLTKNTHIAMGTAVESQLTWATIDYLQAAIACRYGKIRYGSLYKVCP